MLLWTILLVLLRPPRSGAAAPTGPLPLRQDDAKTAYRFSHLGTMREVSARVKNHVRESGDPEAPPLVFAHGFGCDSTMWRYIAPRFEDRFRVILFDYVGHGGATRSPYDPIRYTSLDGYARDVLDICEELDLRAVTFVGHSVSAMIGALAAIAQPHRFARLVMIGPSPRYIDEDDYRGGFSREDIDGLLEALESNYLGWSSAMAPVIMGNEDRPALSDELANAFCRTDPDIARRFATATFLSDNRSDLEHVPVPTLVMQCTDDVIAPREVGDYVNGRIPESRIVYLQATGHCPNLSAPSETADALERFLEG
jgi:sigma-B regulation protein RsbQ